MVARGDVPAGARWVANRARQTVVYDPVMHPGSERHSRGSRAGLGSDEINPHRGTFGRALKSASMLFATGALIAACSSGGGSDQDAAERTTTAAIAPTTDADVVLDAGSKIATTVDERFGSYNIEMVEVTGGTFWRPYDATGEGRVDRPPIDLASPKLRNLAKALGPAYIRVSGSWATDTWFDPDATTGTPVPEGFQGVLTGEQWKGVGAFADAVDGEVITSFAGNEKVRDADGAWQPDQARALLEFSEAHDVPLVGAELFNEVNLPVGMPADYTPADFARDIATFEKLRDEVDPDLKIIGPGTTAEVTPLVVSAKFGAADILEETGPVFDVFSFHSYPKVSERCASPEGPEVAFDADYLSRISTDTEHYVSVRDQFLPEAPVWLTETAEAACGGDRWAATYRDVVRYVDTLGRTAAGGVDVVFHNTLAASDYGLLDEDTFDPRPDYWAAVLWHQLMGPRVVDSEPAGGPSDLTVYGHCTPGRTDGSTSFAVVNTSTETARTVAAPSGEATAYVLSSDDLDGDTVALNGKVLEAGADGKLPKLAGKKVSGAVEVPPASVAFVVVDGAGGNSACAKAVGAGS